MLRYRRGRRLRILDFDIENRPLSYGGNDFSFGEVTAIAWSWVGQDEVDCELLTKRAASPRRMLARFVEAYRKADMVTGHYIRNHDLPTVNGALFELRMPLLEPKLTCDTKNDLRRFSNLSKAQENLAEMLDLEEEKHHMNQVRWRKANRLGPEGLEQTRKRVVDDVRQHKELRLALLDAGVLKAPRVWVP